MGEQLTPAELVTRPSYEVQLQDFEHGLLALLGHHELPTQGIFMPINEREAVFRNVPGVIDRIEPERRAESVYIAKFIAAVAAGLFDAALNYLWDQTVAELRRRVIGYDLAYFYDNAVANEERRRDFRTEDDLVKLEDSQLIYGAREIGLISDYGFRHLDFIRYNRNWASAAHPNQNELTGLQLVGWLETCIREVISLPLSDVAVQIRKLLANIRTTALSPTDARQVGVFFANLRQEQVNNLASGFFGMYVRPETVSQTRQNVHLLLPLLWDRVDQPTRRGFGIKYGQFAANNDQAPKQLARQFLELVSGLAYLPDDLRAVELAAAIENLLNVHRALNNFYNEPPFARELQRLIGEMGDVPRQVRDIYVLGLVEVFLTNGNGVAWNAEPVYLELLQRFDADQALTAVLSFTNPIIVSRLQFPRCREKYRELVGLMQAKVSAPAVRELIDDIQAFSGPLERMKDDSRIKRRVTNVGQMLDLQLHGGA